MTGYRIVIEILDDSPAAPEGLGYLRPVLSRGIVTAERGLPCEVHLGVFAYGSEVVLLSAQVFPTEPGEIIDLEEALWRMAATQSLRDWAYAVADAAAQQLTHQRLQRMSNLAEDPKFVSLVGPEVAGVLGKGLMEWADSAMPARVHALMSSDRKRNRQQMSPAHYARVAKAWARVRDDERPLAALAKALNTSTRTASRWKSLAVTNGYIKEDK